MKISHSEKYSPQAKQAITQAFEEGECARIMVSLVRELTAADHSLLEQAGARVQTKAGDVLTAEIPLERLPKLAALGFVRFIELAVPLYLEKEAGRNRRQQ